MIIQGHLLENRRIKISVKVCHIPYPKFLTTTVHDFTQLKYV